VRPDRRDDAYAALLQAIRLPCRIRAAGVYQTREGNESTELAFIGNTDCLTSAPVTVSVPIGRDEEEERQEISLRVVSEEPACYSAIAELAQHSHFRQILLNPPPARPRAIPRDGDDETARAVRGMLDWLATLTPTLLPTPETAPHWGVYEADWRDLDYQAVGVVAAKRPERAFGDRFRELTSHRQAVYRELPGGGCEILYPVLALGRLRGALCVELQSQRPSVRDMIERIAVANAPAIGELLEAGAIRRRTSRTIDFVRRWKGDLVSNDAALMAFWDAWAKFEPSLQVRGWISHGTTLESLGYPKWAVEGATVESPARHVAPQSAGESNLIRSLETQFHDRLGDAPEAATIRNLATQGVNYLFLAALELHRPDGAILQIECLRPDDTAGCLDWYAGWMAEIASAIDARRAALDGIQAPERAVLAQNPVRLLAQLVKSWASLEPKSAHLREIASASRDPDAADWDAVQRSVAARDQMGRVVSFATRQWFDHGFFGSVHRELSKTGILQSFTEEALLRFEERLGAPKALTLADLACRAFLTASVQYYGGLNEVECVGMKTSIPRVSLKLGQTQLQPDMQDMDLLLPAGYLERLPGMSRVSPDGLMKLDVALPFCVGVEPIFPVVKPHVVWMALEELFLLAMRHHRRKPPYQIGLSATCDGDQLKTLSIEYGHDDPASEVKEVRSLMGTNPSLLQAERQIRECFGGLPKLSPDSPEDGKVRLGFVRISRRENLTAYLYYESRRGDNLYRHAFSRPSPPKPWEEIASILDNSSSHWDDSDGNKKFVERPLKLSESYRQRMRGNDIAPQLFALRYLWSQEESNPGFDYLGKQDNLSWTVKDNWLEAEWANGFTVKIPNCRTGSQVDLEKVPGLPWVAQDRFFLSIPEWYEILLKRDNQTWPTTDALIKECSKHCRYNQPGSALLWMHPGPEEGWKNEDAVSDNGHTFRLYLADDGRGVEDEKAFYTKARREDPGALMGHVVPRSRIWCSEMWMYSKTAEGSPLRRVDLYRIKDQDFETVNEPPSLPAVVWEHFRIHGACFEFVFHIPNLRAYYRGETS
jgi:hypothetical protein